MKNLAYTFIKDIIVKPCNLLHMLVLLGGMLMATAQTPGIPYQAYFLDTAGGYTPGGQIEVPLSNADIMLRFEVRNDKGEVEYVEQIPVKTDEYGLASTVIGVGNGTAVTGDFSDINWDGKPKRLYTDIDFSGTGSSFVDHKDMAIVYIPSPGNTTKGTGAPTAANPANPHAGDIYVDDATGDIYTFDGTNWINHSDEPLTVLVDNGDGTMTYTDEEGVANLVNTTVTSGNTLVDDNSIDIDGDGTPDTGVSLQDIADNIDKIVKANETLTTIGGYIWPVREREGHFPAEHLKHQAPLIHMQ